MAVEAQHLLSNNIELMMMNTTVENGNVFGATIGHGVMAPYSTTTQTMIPMSSAAMKSDIGLTYNVLVSRKRSRDVMNQAGNDQWGSFNFLGEDISYQIQQQQLEIDHFITQHTEKVRVEIEQRRKKQTQRIAAAMKENITKKLKSIEEEIEKIGKVNWALEERVKSLSVENQIWRDLARNNEATANALRSNLEQVLTQVHDDSAEDTQSWCGSNTVELERRTMAINVKCNVASGVTSSSSSNVYMKRTCRRCGKGESCVLVLPCRHLCLCPVCGSSVHTCPVCNSIKTASVHVNLESS